MFDEIFGIKAKASTAVDLYLDRMLKVMELKESAIRVNDNKISTLMTDMAVQIITIATKELETIATEFAKEQADKASEEPLK